MRLAVAALLASGLCNGQRSQCDEQPHLNWTAVREDLVTYSTLSEPVMRSRRCFGDTGIWSYCRVSAQMSSFGCETPSCADACRPNSADMA
ncbi:unnamed protein product [Durusdinium trenchii]|uniref:Uncharacterized protein n=1 Tax=Durusdinium trenchii TaxID=1381693 RepID=A0ABP0NI60_9DINO